MRQSKFNPLPLFKQTTLLNNSRHPRIILFPLFLFLAKLLGCFFTFLSRESIFVRPSCDLSNLKCLPLGKDPPTVHLTGHIIDVTLPKNHNYCTIPPLLLNTFLNNEKEMTHEKRKIARTSSDPVFNVLPFFSLIKKRSLCKDVSHQLNRLHCTVHNDHSTTLQSICSPFLIWIN